MYKRELVSVPLELSNRKKGESREHIQNPELLRLRGAWLEHTGATSPVHVYLSVPFCPPHWGWGEFHRAQPVGLVDCCSPEGRLWV